MSGKISFSEYVAEVLQQCTDGLITETELAGKIKKAAWEGMSGVELPTNDTNEIGIS
jgi:hypothetical protein